MEMSHVFILYDTKVKQILFHKSRCMANASRINEDNYLKITGISHIHFNSP